MIDNGIQVSGGKFERVNHELGTYLLTELQSKARGKAEAVASPNSRRNLAEILFKKYAPRR